MGKNHSPVPMKYKAMMNKLFKGTSRLKIAILLSIFVLFAVTKVDAQNTIDVGAYSLVSPMAPHTGTVKNVQIRVRNYGNVAINNIKIGWKINGVAQTDYSGAITLPAPSSTNQISTATVTLSTTFTDVAGVNFEFYTKEANLQTDVSAANDTLRAYTATAIAGTKVVGISPSDYRTLTEACNAIKYSGVSGNLTFKIKAGTYTEAIDLPSSVAYTSNIIRDIVFESQSGSRDVFLVSDNNTQSTVKLDGTDRVTLRNLKIVNRNIITGIGVHLLNGANNNTITNCEITVDSISNGKGFAGILVATIGGSPTYALSLGASGKYTTITNNKISGGYYGVAFNGNTAPRDTGNVVENNTINQVSYYGVFANYLTNFKVKKNKVNLRPSADLKSTGYYLTNISTVSPGNNEVTFNYVTGAGQYGIYMSQVIGTGAPTNRYVNISNNMIAGGFFSNNSGAADLPQGLSLNSCGWANVYFNSVRMDAPTRVGAPDNTSAFYVAGSNASGNIRVFNNVFYNANKGYAFYNAAAAATNPISITNNNDYFVALLDSNTNPLSGFTYWNGAPRINLRDLIAVSLKDQATISKDPSFFSNTDLHTLSTDLNQRGSTSPLTEVSTDYDGELRDQINNPDIGCDEFGPGGEDFAIIGITPDVFRYKKATPWKIFVRYQGPTTGTGKTLYFLYKINGVDQKDPDSAIQHTFNSLGGYFSVENFTVPIKNYITRQNYQSFQFTVYIYAGYPGDLRRFNDSLTVDVCVGLEGTFLIDKNKSPDDTTFTSLQQTYEYLKCGVAGPTIIELADGTYDEQMYLWKIRNSSATNTITFKSQNSAFGSKLTFLGGTSENHATVLLNNAQYITLNELTIENRNTANGSCIQLAGNSKFNTISKCIIRIDSTLTPYPNSLVGIVSSKLGTLMTTPASYGINSNNNQIINNKILGGHYGIAMFGQDTAQRDLGNFIKGNIITSFHKSGIYLEYADTRVQNNVLTGKFGMDLNAIAIYAKGLGDRLGDFTNEISGNKIYDITYQGIFLQSCLGKKVAPAKKSSFIVTNNMVAGGFTTSSISTACIHMNTCVGISIVNNTLLMDAPRTSSNSISEAVARCMIVNNTNNAIESYNNIFYSTNGAISLEYYTKLKQGGNTGLTNSENNSYYTTYPSKTTPLILIQRISNLNTPKKNYTFAQKTQTPQSALTTFKNDNDNSTRDRKSIALPLKFEKLPYDLHTYDPAVESKGANLEVKEDIDKEPRKSKTPDIGCDEFTIPLYDLDIYKIRNPLLSKCKPNKLSVILRNRGKYSLQDVTVILAYSVLSDTYSASGKDTVKLTMKTTGSEQIYTFKKPFTINDYASYNVCVSVVKFTSASIQDTVYTNNTRCADLGVGIGGDFYAGYTSPFPNYITDTSRAFPTLQAAVNYVANTPGIACETNIFMNPGASPFIERVIVPKILVALDSPFLNILPYNTTVNTDVVLQQPTSPAGDPDKVHYTLRLQAANFVRIKYLNIKNTGVAFGSGVHITRNCQSVVVDGCKIEVNSALTSNLFYPIAFTSTNKLNIIDANSFAKNGSNNKIIRNELIGGYAGVALLGASQVDFDYNNIIDSNIIRDYYQFGIYTKNNTIKRIGFNSLTPRASAATTCVSISYNFAGEGGIINANLIKDSKQIGIKVYGVEAFDDNQLIVSNNWITNNFSNSTADSSGGILIKRSSNIGLYYNSIRYNGLRAAINVSRDSLSSLDDAGNLVWTYVTPTGIKFFNNIVKVDSIGPQANKPYAVYFNSKDALSEFEHNDYFTGYANKFAYYPVLDQNTFAIWQLSTAKDLSSFNLEPGFVDNFNLNLVDTLKFDKKGIPVKGIVRDFNNRKRSPRVTDIGSIEYEKEMFNVSLFKIVNEKAVYGSNTFKVSVLNEGNANLSGQSICLEYSIDSGKTWIGNQTVNLTELTGRYDEQIVSFNLKHLKNDFLVIPLCVRIVPTCRLPSDTITQYETICKDLCVGLEKGIYTIGKNGTEDFSTFTQAVVALVCGFDSTIIFKVSPGVYTERFSIPPIATRRDTSVTFTSSTNNPKDVIIQYSNTGIQTAHHVAQIAGAKYITFKNLTFKSAATARASGIHLADSAAYNTIENCEFYFDSVSDVNTLVGVVASGTIAFTDPSTANNNNIRNCKFFGGAYGIRFIGIKDNAVAGPNQVINCTFTKNNTAGIDVFYAQIDSISKNKIVMRKGNPLSAGINVYGALTDFIITENSVVNGGNAAFVMDSCRTLSRGLIANNMFAGGQTADGKFGDQSMLIKNTGAFPSKGINSSGSIDVINNSILYDGVSDSSSAFRIYKSNSLVLYNNIFANYGRGYAVDFTSDPASTEEFLDANANVLYTTDTSLARWKGIVYDSLSGLSLVTNSPFTGVNASVVNPLFRSHIDLHTNTKELDGKGVPSAVVTTDIDNEERNPGTPDIGADEFIPGFDVAMHSIITPVNNASFRDSVLVWVKVKNTGSVNLSTFKVKYKFDETIVDSTVVIVPLKPDSSLNVIFKKKFATREAGKHILTTYTEITKTDINGKIVNNDFNNLNDTLKLVLYSKDTSDIGVSQFLTPANNLPVTQNTAVEVRVANYGNLTATSYKVTLKVNGLVKEVKTINTPLMKNQVNDVSFNYQINPDSAVTFNICTYTTLGDDVIPENDSNCIAVSTLVGLTNNQGGDFFSAYPNPTNGTLNFGLNIDKDETIQLSIFDLAGRLIKQENLGIQLKGEVKFSSDLKELAEGTYLFIINAGEKKYNGRFVRLN